MKNQDLTEQSNMMEKWRRSEKVHINDSGGVRGEQMMALEGQGGGGLRNAMRKPSYV
jgi:hypothetical protein